MEFIQIIVIFAIIGFAVVRNVRKELAKERSYVTSARSLPRNGGAILPSRWRNRRSSCPGTKRSDGRRTRHHPSAVRG